MVHGVVAGKYSLVEKERWYSNSHSVRIDAPPKSFPPASLGYTVEKNVVYNMDDKQ